MLMVKFACPASTSHAGVPDTIAKSLAAQIDSVQVCPGVSFVSVWMTLSIRRPMRRAVPFLFGIFAVRWFVGLAWSLFKYFYPFLGVITTGSKRP